MGGSNVMTYRSIKLRDFNCESARKAQRGMRNKKQIQELGINAGSKQIKYTLNIRFKANRWDSMTYNSTKRSQDDSTYP